MRVAAAGGDEEGAQALALWVVSSRGRALIDQPLQRGSNERAAVRAGHQRVGQDVGQHLPYLVAFVRGLEGKVGQQAIGMRVAQLDQVLQDAHAAQGIGAARAQPAATTAHLGGFLGIGPRGDNRKQRLEGPSA